MSADSEVAVLQSVVGKLDSSIEKISEATNSISKLLAVHEQRLTNAEVDVKELDTDIKVLHKRVTEMSQDVIKELHDVEMRLGEGGMEQHNQLSREIADVGSRVNQLENWKWYLIGAVVAITTFANSDIIANIIAQ